MCVCVCTVLIACCRYVCVVYCVAGYGSVDKQVQPFASVGVYTRSVGILTGSFTWVVAVCVWGREGGVEKGGEGESVHACE